MRMNVSRKTMTSPRTLRILDGLHKRVFGHAGIGKQPLLFDQGHQNVVNGQQGLLVALLYLLRALQNLQMETFS